MRTLCEACRPADLKAAPPGTFPLHLVPADFWASFTTLVTAGPHGPGHPVPHPAFVPSFVLLPLGLPGSPVPVKFLRRFRAQLESRFPEAGLCPCLPS